VQVVNFLLFGGDIQKIDGLGALCCIHSVFSRVLGPLCKHPSNIPNLPIKELVSEPVIPGFKVPMAEGLRQTQSWKWNTEILNPLPKLYLNSNENKHLSSKDVA
jgi:hypothetical protein